MTDKEKEAIERCKQLIKAEHANWIGLSNQNAINIVLNLIEKVSSEFAIGKRQYEQLIDDYDELNFKNINQQKELEKKDKIIDEMAEQIYDEWYIPNIKTIDDVKEYFINKVEKEYKDDN